MEDKNKFWIILAVIMIVLVAVLFIVNITDANAVKQTEPSPTPDCLERSFGLYCLDDPSPVDNPNIDEPTEEADKPSTQDTDCSNLDALTAEVAMADCGEEKPVEYSVVKQEVKQTVETQIVAQELEAFPSTGFDLFGLL